MELTTSHAVMTRNRYAEFRRGLKEAIPLMIGAIPFALVLGAQATQNGLSPLAVPLMTGLNFAGGSEVAAIQLWAAPPPVLLIVAVTLLINSRHLLMGATLVPFLQYLPKKRIIPALFFLCDESWALTYADTCKRAAKGGLEQAFSFPYYLGTGISFYGMWVSCTGAGAILGPALGNLETWGFHMAFPAVFMVLLKGMWRGLRSARPWFVSFGVAFVVYICLPGAWYMIAGSLAGLGSAYYWGESHA